ncbi:hypothetical protein BCR43DRAFT_499381 [Syncephalastrum racemosum]|uniref:Response regulatory domain-containing protein n=1 Tax=Syncephalastrum racemosum TaxID=13706 RepID=A0A1X2H1F7_SYNRA|nr:hypothetical protein BCR43DRAFT_499381 [Syncephalastrum racemosum]
MADSQGDNGSHPPKGQQKPITATTTDEATTSQNTITHATSTTHTTNTGRGGSNRSSVSSSSDGPVAKSARATLTSDSTHHLNNPRSNTDATSPTQAQSPHASSAADDALPIPEDDSPQLPPTLSRLSSDDWIPHGKTHRPHLAYLRSAWSTQDLRRGTVTDEAPQSIKIPPFNVDDNTTDTFVSSLRQEVDTTALAAVFFCTSSALLGTWAAYTAQPTQINPTSLYAHTLFLFACFWCFTLIVSYLKIEIQSLHHIAILLLGMTLMLPLFYETSTLPASLAAIGFALLCVASRFERADAKQRDAWRRASEAQLRSAQTYVDQSMEILSNQRLGFLTTVSQEVQDAALMVMTTLEQFSPASILANTHELLSACSIAVPIASISAITTTIKQVCYVSSHLQLLGRLLRDPENDMHSEVKRDFDIGELVQNMGDALAGMAAKLDVNLVIYHSDNAMHHHMVLGDEDAIRHSLLNLMRNILEGCTPGAILEFGLNATPKGDVLAITFEITHTTSPAIPDGLSPAILPNANLTAQLLAFIGGDLTVEEVGKNKTRFDVTMQLDMARENSRRILLLEEPSFLRFKQFQNIRFSTEPTLQELHKFIKNLKGLKMVLHARELSVFAKHLTSCLASWNADISHVPVERIATTPGEEQSEADDSERSSVASQPIELSADPQPNAVTSPRGNSNTNTSSNTPQVPSPALEEQHIHSIPPAFILIDDDVETLERKLREFRTQPAVSAHALQTHQQQQRKHKHNKSGPQQNFFHQGTTAIIHFTSLTHYKRVRDTIQWHASAPATAPFSVPRLVVVPKPAGPRRFLTALHTAWHNAVVEPHYMPIATSPLSPLPKSIASMVQTPSTPGSAHHGTPRQEWPHRPSPGEPTTKRRPNSGIYSPPAASALVNDLLDGNNYFSAGAAGGTGSGQPSAGGLPSPRANRRRSHTDIQQQASHTPPTPMTAQPSQPTPPPATSQAAGATGIPPQPPTPTVPSKSPSKSPGEARRRSNTASQQDRPNLEAITKAKADMEGEAGEGKKEAGEAPAQEPAPAQPAKRMTNFKLNKRKKSDKSSAFANIVSPPINVLIVEDNMINQAILSTWMKKHKIKYSVASNGQEAVERWKGGGFHLVLMDIQLPVMDGIAATKMIREIEKEQKIGVLPTSSSTSTTTTTTAAAMAAAEDVPLDLAQQVSEQEPPPSTFRSPVIIVALTASSLESDRNAALAAGCNDFLTKPVSLEWLEKKIIEWGCMQALIDFEGWRRWKQLEADNKPAKNNNNNNNNNNNTNNSNNTPSSTASASASASSSSSAQPKKGAPDATVASTPTGNTPTEDTVGEVLRKGIVLPGAAGLNKRRYSTYDETKQRQNSKPVLAKSGSETELIPSHRRRSPPRHAS